MSRCRAWIGLIWLGVIIASGTGPAHGQTENTNAAERAARIDGVAIPAPLNQRDKVGHAISGLKTGRNPYNAMRYLAYLGTEEAQAIYAKYGFVAASAEELKMKPIPAAK